jgi:hypothetical protein
LHILPQSPPLLSITIVDNNTYTKKAQTVALLELLPALLAAIGKLQQQNALNNTKQIAKTTEASDSATQKESKKRLYINQFYKSVCARLADIINEVSFCVCLQLLLYLTRLDMPYSQCISTKTYTCSTGQTLFSTRHIL